MGQNSNGLDWFINVFNKMEGRCLEMCDVLEKVKLRYLLFTSYSSTISQLFD